MLVLLPPSEGKTGATRGAPLDPGALSLPALAPARERVLDELTALCGGDPAKARQVLGLSEGLGGEVARNAALRTAPARPAGQLYTGVLYDALGPASLSAAARRRARESLLIFSGLWGAVRITDRIPAYRCSAGVRLPGLGPLAGFWKEPLAEALPAAAGAGPVLDLRSSAYAAMWRPAGDLARRTVTVRVLQARVVDGVEKRSVVSHFNKATKGRVVRALLEAGPLPRTPAKLAGAVRDLGYVVEEGAAGRLDIVVTEL
ncbi:peroxide stress protein YaaA [Streptomyces sp. NBC_01803]|uniref:peroxide stress protein YaaA n=1 Tax=Streptomyces sp. NBC_01803 TaxID=2975946 RepID=UPI002DD9A2B1|nr:peroxide stress protein YaaA [Streptomyces sp. NBC_01803]WSA46439.1 peroxide stress protein YaaA [Streptomyces sp. NBC_01803]